MKGVKLLILESVFLTHTGISYWFYTDSAGTLRKRNLAKSKVHSAQDLLAHLIDDNRSREKFDPSITGKLCWLRNNSTRRLLELSQIENFEGRNASMVQVKLVQQYVSNLHSNDATFLLSMKYINSAYVAKLHKLVNKERTPLKHPHIYSKALLIARQMIFHIEEACSRRVLSLTCEFMLDKDGQMVLVHTTDCKVIDPKVCLQLPIKSEADLASLKSLIDRRRATKSIIEAEGSSSAFKHGQLRNDDSFTGDSIPYNLDLGSIEPSPERSPDTSPRHKVVRTESLELQLPLSYTDTWTFKIKLNSSSSTENDAFPKKRPSKLDLSKAPSKLNLNIGNYADNISDNFVEIIAKTFEKRAPLSQSTRLLPASQESEDHANKRIRMRYERKGEMIEEFKLSKSSIFDSAPKRRTSIQKQTPKTVDLPRSNLHIKSPTAASDPPKLSSRRNPRYLSPSFIRKQAILALSPQNRLKRYKSPYSKRL